MESRTVVSISDNTDIGEGWRVRVFYLPANWNALSRTLDEAWFDTEHEARAFAADMAQEYGADMQG